jgi:cob(I)alamin adenosyltransferase
MIINFTGDGKGKTSAALGIALRASGWGKRVAIIQFIKGNKAIGEYRAIKKIDKIEIFQYLDNINLNIGLPEEKHRRTIPNIINHFKQLLAENRFELFVLDEINNAVDHKLLEDDEILSIIKKYPKIDFILTGRNASKRFLAAADLVTEMKKIKHPFDKNTIAKKGIDY